MALVFLVKKICLRIHTVICGDLYIFKNLALLILKNKFCSHYLDKANLLASQELLIRGKILEWLIGILQL